MSDDNKLCHGQIECLNASSTRIRLHFAFKMLCRLRSFLANTVWHLKIRGVVTTSELAFFKVLKAIGIKKKVKPRSVAVCDEVLNLQPGELVEVKSEQEIMPNLDLSRRYKGLSFMRGMREFCGKRLKVYKRVDLILLESNHEFRKLKNTVLLEGAICDGQEQSGCDRSCFYYWKEAWLRRVNE